jgi:hypothetical protein
MTITASPLCWPPGKPRTNESKRKHGRFCQRNERGYGTKGISLAQARIRVTAEIEKFKKIGNDFRIHDLIISTNLQLRNDGFPRSGQKQPDDKGVAVYFELDGKPRCIPCDHYLRIEDNLAAIAATLEALRTIERHGSEMFEAAFTGFTALPDPDSSIKANWRFILDNYLGNDLQEAKQLWKKLRSKQHPDRGGDKDLFHAINKAWEQAQQELD